MLSRASHFKSRLWLMILSELLSDHDKKDAHDFPPDTLRGAMAAVGKRQSMTSSTATTTGGTSAVPRSTSQPGNCWGGLIFYSNLSGCLLGVIDFSCMCWKVGKTTDIVLSIIMWYMSLICWEHFILLCNLFFLHYIDFSNVWFLTHFSKTLALGPCQPSASHVQWLQTE